MKNKAKLLIIALILALFSIGAVAAATENITLGSGDLNSVSYETPVSLSLETDTINAESSALDSNQLSSEITVDENSIDDYKSSSDDVNLNDTIEVKSLNKNSLGASNDENVLGATITPSSTSFEAIRNAINNANDGDIIDLNGLTYHGTVGKIITNKQITIQNGILDGRNIRSECKIEFTGVTLKNIHFTNYNTGLNKWDKLFIFRDSHLENVNITKSSNNGYMSIFAQFMGSTGANLNFDQITSGTCVADIKYSTLTNVNFTNSKVTDDTKDTDTGQFTVMVQSKLDNCNFINTSSKQHGGAICMAQQENTVINTNFINCTAWVGGAIYAHGDFEDNKKYTIENCKFINCSAEAEGGALGLSHNNMDVKNCVFINNTATKGAGIMVGGINYPSAIDGDNTHGHNITIDNCYFEKNNAIQEGGAIHISGDNNTVLKSQFYDNEAPEGGAVHITGDNAAAIDSIFDDNFAHGGKGAAIYVKGNDASVDNSKFTNHDSEMGTVYIKGNYFNCTDSEFRDNTATHGGAGIYVEGDHTYVSHSSFRGNNASMHGGAIHTVGGYAKILHSNFTYNNAIPNSDDPEYGLGGAVYIDGDYNEISFSKFKHNTARNGSAIYNRGIEFVLNDDTFENNQAWSYFLFTEAKPPEAYWSEDMEFLLNITLVAGDNLINAIYNDWHNPTPHGVIDEITFHNVTYTLKPNEHYPTGIRTTTSQEVHPVLGVENSQDGKYLYQDAREDNQVIKVNVTYKDGKVFEYEGKTDRFGNVLISLKKENLSDGEYRPGVYIVTASHPDDEIYTAIENSTTFKVLPHVDVSVTKTSNKDVYFVGENAIFTIKVHGVGTNATNVKVKDILPNSFKFVSANADKGTYNNLTNIWDIGFLPHGASHKLTLTVQTTELGTFDNVVNVTCTEKDWDLSNNVDNKTIHVNLYYTKEANVTHTSAGEYIEYYLRVFNIGTEDYTETVLVRDAMPQGIKYESYELAGADLIKFTDYSIEQIWEITNISAGYCAKITVKARTLKDGIWNNTMRVWDYPPVNATVNVSSNADLRVIKEVSSEWVNKGDIINWTIQVKNEGPSIAMGAYVTDILPNGLSIVGFTDPSKGNYNRDTNRWTIGDMNVGDTETLIITTRVTISAHNITNVAAVNSTTPDPNPDNNEDNATTYFNPDVSIEKIVSTQLTSHGSVISWTIVVTNNGPNTAAGVYVIDKLPAGLNYINSTITKGSAYNPVSGRWTIGNLNEDESANLTINTKVTVYDGFISNNATVYSEEDSNPDNNYGEDYTQVKTEADVGVVKLVSNQTAHYGDEIIWTVKVTNYGPNVAENVVLIDYLPIEDLEQLKQPFVSKGQISHEGITGRWDIGDMEVGETQYCEVYTKVITTAKTIINTVAVTSDTSDPNLSNNRAENGTDVPPECDIGVVKRVNNITPHKGDYVIWTITVTNHGPNVAENVVMTDVLPAGLKYRATNGTYSAARNTWTVGNLNVREARSITITTEVINTGNITNEVTVTTDTYDKNLTNNYDNKTIEVQRIADLVIVKVVSNKNAAYGELINWTITVTNKGPDTARNVVVDDLLPAGLIYVTHISNPKGLLYDKAHGIWQVRDLASSQSVSLTITTRVNVTNATIRNIAVVTSDTPDNDTSNNEANNTTHVGPVADLEIIKLVDNHSPKKGENVTWTVIVTNKGPDTAINAIAKELLPEGLILIRAYPTGQSSYDLRTNTWYLLNMTKGQSINMTLVTQVNVTKKVLTNIITVSSDTPDPDLSNNEAHATIDVGHDADLGIIKTVSNSTPKYGDEITWTITVKNNGPDDAIDVTVNDSLPKGLVWISDNGNGTYDHNNGIWTIGTLTNQSSLTLTIRTLVNVTNATITNVAVVDSDTNDPVPENNTDDDTIKVRPEADLLLYKFVNIPNSKYNDEVVWTIYVTNKGPDTAVDAYVYDKLPAGLIYSKSNATMGSYDEKTNIWTIGNLTKGKSVYLTIFTIVNVTNATITNYAVVNSSTHDPNPDNNNDSVSTDVESVADLEVIKEVSNKKPHFGEEVIWTITVVNHGPCDAFNVIVNDKLPKGLIYKTDDSKGAYNPNTGIWTIGNLTNGSEVVLNIRTLVNVTNATIRNVAIVNSTTPDNNTENNKDNNTTDVPPEADLEIIKLVSNKTAHEGDVITWTIVVTNKGPDTALEVYVRDTLPSDLVLRGYSKTKGIFDRNDMTWYIKSLAKGETQTLTLTTLVNVTNKILTNIVNVTSDVYDPNETNNKANNTTDVTHKADLVVVKAVSDKNPKFGDVITWTVTVTNNGPDVAVNVKVTDKLPAGLIFQGSDGDYNPATGLWIVGDLANGESRSLVITTLVNITNKTIENVANATSDTPGNNTPGNNTTNVGPIADLAIVKFTYDSPTTYDDVVEWTIHVTNNGPDVAKDVYVKDVLPKGVLYYSHVNDVGLYDPNKGIWHIGDMKNGDFHYLSIITTVKIIEGNITNVAVVNSSTPDNNTENNVDNDTTEVINLNADLEIVKVVSNKNPKFGEEITWTITVTNRGPSDAKNVKVTDKLPSGLIFYGANGNYDKDTGIWTVGDLANGKSASLVIRTIVDITNATIRNVAEVTSDTPDSNKTNNKANNTTDVGPKADLVVVKEVSNKNPNKGDIITWTITVTNKGPDVAVNTKVTDKLPFGLTFMGADGDYNPITGIWTVGDLANGASAKLVITTQVDITNAAIENVATPSSETPGDNTPGNDTTDVPPEADLEIIKRVSDKTTDKGNIITWTVVVTNMGPDAATNVYVKDTLPVGLVYNAHVATKGLFDSNTLTWYINALNNGESATLTINTLVNVTDETLTNIVTVTNDVYDPNENNNKANNTTTVDKELPADLEVMKIVSNANPHKGDVIEWHIIVTNNGPGDAKDVTVTDKLPAGLKFISADGNYDADTGVWTIGELANREFKTLVIKTSVEITNANITNVAVVSSTTPDNNPDNNKDNDTTEIKPEADVKVVKFVSNPTPSEGDIITWTIIVTNLGPDTADNVVVNESLPEGLTLVSARGSKGAYSDDIWNIGTLENGEIATLTLTTEVTASSGTITNAVNASSSTYDPNKTNNKDSEKTTPKSPKDSSADLELIKTADKQKVKVGDTFIWIVTVINHGPDKATGVCVTEILETDFTELVAYKVSKGTFNVDDDEWLIGDMEVGERVTLQIMVRALFDGEVENFASVESDTHDPNIDNNEDSATVLVVVEDNDDEDAPDSPHHPSTPKKSAPTMHATGNPIVMVLLALFAIAGVSLRRKI